MYFSIDGRDVLMYRSRADAESFLEAYDVRPDQDTIFRSDGAIVRLRTQGRNVVVTDEVVGEDPAALAAALRLYLVAARSGSREGETDRLAAATLAELVDEFARSEGG